LPSYNGNKGGAVKTTIDRFGRLVVPKDIREKLGLKPGVEIEIEEQESEIVIRQVEHESPLLFEDGVLIFAGTAAGDLVESACRHWAERKRG
jgi:AbrB family looped-hinge helix DNA binding protein